MSNISLEKPNLPTPQQLAKRAKDATVPLSLRVSEETLATFDGLAEQLGLKTGTLINSLLDSYAEIYRDGATLPISKYLSKRASKLASEDDDSLLIKLYNHRNLDNTGVLMELSDNLDLEWLLEAFHQGSDEVYYAINGAIHCDLNCSAKSKTARLELAAAGDISQLTIPQSKWALVVAVVDAYLTRLEQLHQVPDAVVSPQLLTDLTEAINSTSDCPVLATKIATLLANFVEE